MVDAWLLPFDHGAHRGAVAQVGDDHAAARRAGPMLRQHFGDVLVGQAVEAVAAHALGGDGARQGEQLRDFGLAAVEGGVEAGHLRHAGQRGAERVDAGQVVRLVQRRQRNEAAQFVDHGGIEHRSGCENFCAPCTTRWPTPAMLPAGFVAVQPVDQQAQGGLVRGPAGPLEFEVAVVQHRAGGVLDLEVWACLPAAPMPSIWPTSSGCWRYRGAGSANSANLIEDEPALRVRMASLMVVRLSCVWRAP
jgi:hypothetical protein